MDKMYKLTNGLLRKSDQNFIFVTDDGESWDASFAAMSNSASEIEKAYRILNSKPDSRTFEQRPTASEFANQTLLTEKEAAQILGMTTNIADINQAAWLSLNGYVFGNIIARIFPNDTDNSSSVE